MDQYAGNVATSKFTLDMNSETSYFEYGEEDGGPLKKIIT